MTLLDWPDLPDDERACLRVLARAGSADAVEVAAALGLDAGAAAEVLGRLGARGAAAETVGGWRPAPGRRRTRAAGLGDLLGDLAGE
ncbi:MAG: hypothetical protein ACKOTZ_08975 [Chloroflexota bacterium]